jgi:mannose-6-phosphate isomerase-like protein (cupin superfamily)
MSEVINFKKKFTKFSELWTPKILGQFDNYHLKAAKMKGEFVWHSHDDADELFIVVAGVLKICLRDKEIILHSGECFIVPKGVEHKTVAEKEAHVLFIEKAGTLNTGDQIGSSKTVSQEEWI